MTLLGRSSISNLQKAESCEAYRLHMYIYISVIECCSKEVGDNCICLRHTFSSSFRVLNLFAFSRESQQLVVVPTFFCFVFLEKHCNTSVAAVANAARRLKFSFCLPFRCTVTNQYGSTGQTSRRRFQANGRDVEGAFREGLPNIS